MSNVEGLNALSLILEVSGLLFVIFLPCEAEKSRDGLKLIEELTGTIDTEEVLGIIFKSFCIGK